MGSPLLNQLLDDPPVAPFEPPRLLGIGAFLDHKPLRRFAGFEVGGDHSPRIGAYIQPIDELPKVKAVEADDVFLGTHGHV